MLTLADSEQLRLFVLIGVMIGVIFIATVAILIVRKKILANDKAPASGSLMEDFRRLHASGQLSDQEFQALRTRMAARMKGDNPARTLTMPAPAPRPAASLPRPAASESPPRRPPESKPPEGAGGTGGTA